MPLSPSPFLWCVSKDLQCLSDSFHCLGFCLEQAKADTVKPWRWPTAATQTPILSAVRRSAFATRVPARPFKPPWSIRALDVPCTTLMSQTPSSRSWREAFRREGCMWTGVRPILGVSGNPLRRADCCIEFQGQAPKVKERRKNRTFCWGSWIC